MHAAFIDRLSEDDKIPLGDGSGPDPTKEKQEVGNRGLPCKRSPF